MAHFQRNSCVLKLKYKISSPNSCSQNANVSSRAMNFKGRNFMVVHGTADDNVHFQHTAQLVKALTEADVDFRVQVSPSVCLISVFPFQYNRVRIIWPLDNSHFMLNSHNPCFPTDSIDFDVWIIHTFCSIVMYFCVNYLGSTVTRNWHPGSVTRLYHFPLKLSNNVRD